MMSNHQDPLRPLFEAWATGNLPRSYSLAMEEGDYAETQTRVAFSAFKAGLKLSDGYLAGLERGAVIAEEHPAPIEGLIAAAIRAEAAKEAA